MSRNETSDEYGYALTAAEQLRRWDAGESIWMVEMGGLGPGYEQCIHVACMEVVRDLLGQPLPTEDSSEADKAQWREKVDAALHRADKFPGMGMSGAQAGAARNLAGFLLRYGPSKAYADLKANHPDRAKDMIQVCRSWPNPPTPTQETTREA